MYSSAHINFLVFRFVPRFHKTFYSSHHVYLLSEACLGGDLFSFLEANGPQDTDVAKYIVACVIEGLNYLHHALGVIHRDVKTENLLIGKRGTTVAFFWYVFCLL